MEIQEVALLGSLWNESPDYDFQTEILARLPVEFVYTYRIICKQWNDFLSSNYFLTKWTEAEASLNFRQPRLVLCDGNPKMPCMAFCFYSRTWIKTCFNFSFLQDWIPRFCDQTNIYFRQSVAGLVLIDNIWQYLTGTCGRLCNPYTRTFVEIPAPQVRWRYSICIIVNENNNQLSNTAYKVVSVGDDEVLQRQLVEIYEPSQKRWNTVGYFADGLILNDSTHLVYHKGSFYAHCRRGDESNGIVCFTIPLEGNGSAVAPNPIPVLFAPFPFRMQSLQSSPWIKVCGSCLLLIAVQWMPLQVEGEPVQVEQAGGEGETEEEMELEGEGEVGQGARSSTKEVVITIWEFKNEEVHPVVPSNSPSWEWVEIARMPSFLCKKWLEEPVQGFMCLNRSCIGVGDHVCFTPCLDSAARPSQVVEVVDYNLIDNTWNWLPSCPTSHFCGDNYCPGSFYAAIAFEPNLV